ncbi:MAG: class I SAM-dependent methyltransferase [Candidatus Rokubacteria bacterium]|nr:class I SAM-dependent methyltransferase [Candidatus Rokubacteria bacterium]
MTHPGRPSWIAPDPAVLDGLAKSLDASFPHYDANVREWLPAHRQAAILDYGCGPGGFLRYVGLAGYANVTGFDVDARYAAFCRTHSRARIAQADDGTAFLRSAAGGYDFILAREVAYYVPRPELAGWFTALAGALRPGGRLVIEVFNGAPLSGLWPWMNDPYITTVFSEHSLRALAEGAGLTIIVLRSERYPRKGLRQLAWLAGRKLLGRLWSLVYLLERGRDPRNPTLFGKSLVLVAERHA